MLSNPDARRIYGAKLWQFIPIDWRPWWLSAISQFECYNGVTADSPSSFFIDRSSSLCSFEHDITSYKLSRLIDGCNTLCQMCYVRGDVVNICIDVDMYNQTY